MTGDEDWTLALSGGIGYLAQLGHQEKIIDRFFLGGDNLRGFQSGGAGPHALGINTVDSIGGRFIYTADRRSCASRCRSRPTSASAGRAFVDVGSLSEVDNDSGHAPSVGDNPRRGSAPASASPGSTPFGLINIDVAQAVVKQKYDQTQLFRFGFGTRF